MRFFKIISNLNNNKIKLNIIGIVSILLISIIPISYVVGERGVKFPYYDSSDSDFIYVGNALVFNSGISQSWTDHPGYLQMLSLSIYYNAYKEYIHDSVRPAWQKLWYDWVNLYHAPVIAEYFNPLFRLARIYSYILATIFCFVIGVLISYMFNSWTYGLITALFLSTSRGVFVQLTNFRPELLSSLLFIVGFFLLYSSKRINKYSYIKAILVGFFFYCSIITKITVIPVIWLLPWLILFWKIDKPDNLKNIAGFSIFFNNKLRLLTTLLVGSSLFFPLLHIYSIINNPRYYHLLIIANYILIIMLFCYYKIKNIKFVLIWIMFVSFGASIASSILFYRYSDRVLYTVTNVFDVAEKYRSSRSIIESIPNLIQYFLFGIGPPYFPLLSNINNAFSSPIVFLFTISIITTLIFGIKSGYKNMKLENVSIAMIPVIFVFLFVQRSFFNEYIIYLEILFLISFIILNLDHKYSSLTKYILLIIIPFQFYYNYKWVVLPRGQTVSRFCEMVNYAPQFIEIITNDHTATKSFKAGKDRIGPLGKNYEKKRWEDTCVSVLTRDYEIYYHNVDNSYGK